MLCKKEKGTLGHILGHCDVALGKTESSFNRIAWRHELTCPMEARMTYWHETKKYHDLANRIVEKGFTVRFFAFEVGCRGLIGKS
jgi:hypothetical protein